jgi:heme exporter protein C
MWTWFYKLASPPYVYGVAAALVPWALGGAALALCYGLIAGLAIAPPDYQQGEAFRMIYVHVPSAMLSLTVYTVMAAASAVALIWRIKVGHAVASAAAPIGASFTILALFTGSLWGRPMWGTLLGLGSAVDVRTHSLVSVRGSDVAALGVRGPVAR